MNDTTCRYCEAAEEQAKRTGLNYTCPTHTSEVAA